MPTYNHTGTDNKLVGEIPLNMRDSKKLKQKIDTERPLEPREIELLLSWFKHRQGKLLELKEYYNLHHEIEDRVFYTSVYDEEADEYKKVIDTDRPNNKLINDFPGYIVSTASGYFMGNPVAYSLKSDADERILETLQNVFDYNDEAAHNLQLAVDQSLYGTAFEIMWDEDNDESNGPLGSKKMVRFKKLSPLECFMVYDPEDIKEKTLAAFRFITVHDMFTDTTEYILEEYTDMETFVYRGGETSQMNFVERSPHNFKQIPITEYPNNPDRTCDFERVKSLIDAYDYTTSDSVNEAQDFAESFLLIKNMMGTTSGDIKRAKETKVLLTDEDGDAKFLNKGGGGNEVGGMVSNENILTKNIHKFSFIPPLDDMNFSGNASGAAMEFKLWGLEQKVATKERLFRKGICRRIEVIFDYYTTIKGEIYDFSSVEIKFTRNIPRDTAAIADQMVKLRGILPLETLVSLYPKVEDPKSETEKIKKENEEEARLQAQALYGDPFSSSGTKPGGLDPKSVKDSAKYTKPSQHNLKNGKSIRTNLGNNNG